MWQDRNGEDTGLGWEWGYFGVSGEPACQLHLEGSGHLLVALGMTLLLGLR